MRSEAQKRADKKYKELGKDKYKNLCLKIHEDNLDILKEIASSKNLTASKYALRAAFYCAINDIDLSEFTQDFRKPQGEDNEK